MPKDDTETEFFIVTSIYSLLVYENKFYLQFCLDNRYNGYKIIDKQMVYYLDDNLLETDENFRSYNWCITIELI